MAKKTAHSGNPLLNILINVLIPVMALSHLSKDPHFEASIGHTPKFWHVGPQYALYIALAFPISYGIYHFIKTRKANFFSSLGFVSVLLTGGLSLYLWNADGTVKPNADLLFGLKEASIPFILGLAVIGSHFTENPLLNTFLYTDSIFDIQKIETKISDLNQQTAYEKILLQASLMFAASFLLSSILNFGVAIYFLGDLDHTAFNARELFNERIAKLTGWGFAIIGIPVLAFLFLTLHRIVKKIGVLTGLTQEDMLHPHA